MRDWPAYFRAALRLPPHVAARKAIGVAFRIAQERAVRRKLFREPSFLAAPLPGDLRLRLGGWRFDCPPAQARDLAAAAALYLDHRFDLLGSGWVQVRHGMACRGLAGRIFPPGPAVQADPEGSWLEGRVNAANLAESRRIWRLVRGPYVPIDWQLDFKSGYRWSEDTYFRDIAYGRERGADIKVPWELARLQHLPQLALLFDAVGKGRAAFDAPERLPEEFRNQVLDFVAANPPGFGVNWTCAMDVGIRMVNVLVAHDLFVQAGARFDSGFAAVVKRSAQEHAEHILANLEWAEEGRGNHYLSDIVGLLFCAACLPASERTDAWLAFALKQLVAETQLQFLPDGGNIEASTGYHRLSGELVAFAAALALGLSEAEVVAIAREFPPLAIRPPQTPGLLLHEIAGRRTPLPGALFETVARAAALTVDATKPNGEVVQWGDNDSGRLIKATPPWRRGEDEAGAPAENALDHRAFVAAAAALVGRDDLAAWAGSWAEAALVRALSGGRAVRVDPPAAPSIPQEPAPATAAGASDDRREIAIPLPPGASDGVRLAAYPAFGHFAFVGPRLFLAIRCPDWTERRPPGHAHDDALALELQLDGEDLIVDPGTFVYTPLPDERNRYRAADAHFVPRPAGAAGPDLSRGLFAIEGLPSARCLGLGPAGFAGEARGADWLVTRTVLIERDRILIRDAAKGRALAPLLPAERLPPVCIGYGVKTARSPRSV